MNSDDRRKLIRVLKKWGVEIEKEQKLRNFRQLLLPYNIEKTDRCVYRNDAVHFNTIDHRLLPISKQITFVDEPLLGRSVKKTEIKYRDNEIPMLSIEERVSLFRKLYKKSLIDI